MRRRAALLIALLALPLVAPMLRDAGGWPADLAPPGSVRDVEAGTLRLGWRWPAAPWYRAGGAPAPVVALQPIGAADRAASYVALVGPDASPTVAPSWTSAAGWAATGTQYLGVGDTSTLAFLHATATGTMCFRGALSSVPANSAQVAIGSTLTASESGFFLAREGRTGVGANAVRIFVVRSGGAGVVVADARTDNVWGDTASHVACVRLNGPGGTVRIWVDGVERTVTGGAIGTAGTGNATRATNILRANYTSTLIPWIGTQAAVAVWSTALAPAEIAAISAALAGLP